MSSINGTSLAVLKAFIGGANAQYRAAGMPEYQMKVNKNGSVSMPRTPASSFAPKQSAQARAAAEQARAGTTQQTPGSTGPTGATSGARAGAAPQLTGLQQQGDDAFRVTWTPVNGATKYGVWQDGALMGHVTDPSFAGQLAIGARGTLQIDAVMEGGARSARTQPLGASRDASGKLDFQATAPAAPES